MVIIEPGYVFTCVKIATIFLSVYTKYCSDIRLTLVCVTINVFPLGLLGMMIYVY